MDLSDKASGKASAPAKASANKSAPAGELRWAPVAAPAEVKLSKAEAAAFKGCDPDDLMRLTDGSLVGVARTEYADAEKIILYRGGKKRQLPLDTQWGLQQLVPSPSGQRLLIKTDRSPGFLSEGGSGHAEEITFDDLKPRVVITALDGQGGGPPTLWAVEYLGDDDTVVAIMGEDEDCHLLLLERDAGTGEFEEVDNIRARGTGLATSGCVVAVDGERSVGLFGVADHRLIKLGNIKKPETDCMVFSHPVQARSEIRVTSSKPRRLMGYESLLDGQAAKPRPPGTIALRRIVGHHPVQTASAADGTELPKGVKLAKGDFGGRCELSGRELIVVLQASGEHANRVCVYERGAKAKGLGTLVGQLDVPNVALLYSLPGGQFLIDVEGKKGKTEQYLVRVVAGAEGEVSFEKSDRLWLPGTRYADDTLTTTIVNGRGYLDSYAVNPAWFNVPEW